MSAVPARLTEHDRIFEAICDRPANFSQLKNNEVCLGRYIPRIGAF